ncbi:hypothetical protein SFMTTN_1067 [Sulfuriferula multivorans]|uniref:Uncharacterized protein n=2 Tax=Sulfuriferula multivorans TaxID=1559896 RepID=A0A401JCJ2_9PROT|nr:hypothetical protein SFMTTN_1067 [Sulfuriferula multivorans]
MIANNLKKIRENEAKELAKLSANSDEYRTSILECAEWFLEAIRHAATSGKESGYSLAPDFLAAFDIAAGQILGAIQSGTINFDSAKRSAAIAKINQQATEERREADPEFAAFLGATLMSAKAAIATSNK